MAQTKSAAAKDSRTRILLVDDHAVVRFGIAQLINRESDMIICAEGLPEVRICNFELLRKI